MTSTPVPDLAESPVTFRWDGDRLLVHATGFRLPDWVRDLVARIGAAIASRPTRSLQADLSGVTGPISDLDEARARIEADAPIRPTGEEG